MAAPAFENVPVQRSGVHGPGTDAPPALYPPASRSAATTPTRFLDEALFGRCGITGRTGPPSVLPTLFARFRRDLYLQRLEPQLPDARAGRRDPGVRAVTLLDGLVFPRSQFHHSAKLTVVAPPGRFAGHRRRERAPR